MYITDETLEGSKTFIQQGHINLMKSDSKDIYNDTKKLILNFLFIKESSTNVLYIQKNITLFLIIIHVSWAANQHIRMISEEWSDWRLE